MATKTSLRSDVAVHPGEILAEELDAREMTQATLAHRMGRPVQVISEIVNGKKAITAQTALELERVLGTPAHVWMNLQGQYELAQARGAWHHVQARARSSPDLGGRGGREGISRTAIFGKRTFEERRVAKKK